MAKVEIDGKERIVITPENFTEQYAFNKWAEKYQMGCLLINQLVISKDEGNVPIK